MNRLFSIAATCFMCVVLCATTAVGQLRFSQGRENDLRTAATLPPGATVVRPPASFVAALQQGATHTIVIPSSEGDLVIDGTTFDLFTADAEFIAHGEQGDVAQTMIDHALVRGTIRGRARSTVFLAAFDSHVIGYIDLPEAGGVRRILIAPDTVIPGRMASHVVYEMRPGDGQPRQCSAETLPGNQQRADSIFAIASGSNEFRTKLSDVTLNATPYALQLALDCTESFYKNLGSNLSVAASSAIAIAGACAIVYERDANVVIRVPYLRVFTTTDPYPGDIGAKLGRIREHWSNEMVHVKRSVTCLLSGEGGGGLAWVGVLCSGYGYNVSGVDGRVNFPAGGYIWDIDVTSHELGHNIGSSHTHNCGWNPPIDSCWNAEGGCYENTRVQRGTIMSYCHLQSKGTELQFHPRVASLFNRVMERTSCVAPIPSARDTDAVALSIMVPANGGVVTLREQFRPQGVIRNSGRVALRNVVVRFNVTQLNNVVVASCSTTVATLAVGQTMRVQLPPLTLTDGGDLLGVLRVEVANDQHAANDIVTRPFRAAAQEAGTITVVSPNGGETLRAGTTVPVQFTATGVTNVLMQYSIDAGATWKTLQYSVEAAKGQIDWKVPYSASKTCLVRASSSRNASIADTSNAMFTIAVGVDVQAYDIVTPQINASVPTPVKPRVVVRNLGDQDVSDVVCKLATKWVRHTAPSDVKTVTIPRLRAGAQDTIELDALPLLASGVHVADFTVQAQGDENPANDRFAREFTSVGLTPPYALRYEEGPIRVLLQWQIESPASNDRVEVWRGSTAATLEKIATLRATATSYVDLGVSNGATYWYAVRTVRGTQQSVFTPAISAVPTSYPHGIPNGVGMQAPSLISPAANTTGVPSPTALVWSTMPHAAQYEVQVAVDAAFTDLEYVFITRDAGALLVSLPEDATRFWRVRGHNGSTTSDWSKPARFTTSPTCSGSALVFDGQDQRATDATLTWNGGPVTVEYWTYVKRSTLKPSTTFMVGEGDNGGNRFQAHAPWDDGNLYWDYGNIGDKGRISTSFNRFFDQWVHIAFVSDGSSFKAIYINGELAASGNEASAPTGLKKLTIGGMVGNNAFNGSVDEFRIWNVVRTADEIRSSMSRRAPRGSEATKVVGWWRMDENSGTSSKDAVKNRVLTLAAASMWTKSGATIACEDLSPLAAPSFTSGTGAQPLVRDHTHEVVWSAVPVARGAAWYDVEVVDPATQAVITSRNNVVPLGSTARAQFPELPADSTMTIRVRARSTFIDGPWKDASLTTQTPCETSVVRFTGNGERFVSPDFVFGGRAATVEYWSLVNADQVKQSVSFMIGEAMNDAKRFQAHAPWDDKNYYWDYGNVNDAGRVSTSYEKNLGVWTHVAVVSNGYDSMAIYFNGQLAKRSSFTSAPGDLRKLTIGSNPYTNFNHRGSMRDFRIWNVMRSERQIRENMHRRLVGDHSGLVGTWLLDEGEGLGALDATGNSPRALSGTEITWDQGTNNIMHAPAMIEGPTRVYGVDTATYRLRRATPGGIQWRAVGGEIVRGTVDEIHVRWNQDTSEKRIVLTRRWPEGCSDVTTVQVLFDPGMSVDGEDAPQADLSITPNPASDYVRVNWNASVEPSHISLVDMQGRVVWMSAGLQLSAGASMNIPLDRIAAGTYTVCVATARGMQVARVVVQR